MVKNEREWVWGVGVAEFGGRWGAEDPDDDKFLEVGEHFEED